MLLTWGKRLRKNNKSSFSGWRFFIASSRNFAFCFSIAIIVSLYRAFTPYRFLFRGFTCTNDLSWLSTSPSSWFSLCVPYCVNLRSSLSFSLKATESPRSSWSPDSPRCSYQQSCHLMGLDWIALENFCPILSYLTSLEVSVCLLKIITTYNEAISVHRIRLQDHLNVVA